MEVKFKRLHKDAKFPTQATELAGGWDVIATEIVKESGDFVICKLGFALQLPKGHKLTLVPRSSLTKTKWIIQNSPGLGDEDFLQEYQIRFRAIPSFTAGSWLCFEEFPYKEGDRIGQVYLEEVIPMSFVEVEEFDFNNNRGGYGHTGK